MHHFITNLHNTIQPLHIHLTKPPPIPLNIPPHLRKLLVKAVRHGPVFQVPVIALKKRGRYVGAPAFIKEKRVLETERPLEAQVLRIAVRKICCLEELVMVRDEAVADRGPGEKVEGYRVLGAGLGEAGPKPIWDVFEDVLCGIKIVLFLFCSFCCRGGRYVSTYSSTEGLLKRRHQKMTRNNA